jgi:microcystin-dependent protein
MPSSYTASLRFELQAQGENPNTWGQPKLNNLFTRLDFAIAGMFTKALTGDYTLTSSNSADDEARAAMLKFTGAGAGPFTITIPSVPKEYKVWNACTSASVVITTGAGATVTIQPTEIAEIICDGSNVKATGYDGRTEKQYLDQRVVEFGAIPSGGMILWFGSVASIPSGWALCDGANGTPDMRGLFAVGAGGAYAVNATGGANTVALSAAEMPVHAHTQQGTFSSGTESADHSHSGSTDVQGSHTHTTTGSGVGGGSIPVSVYASGTRFDNSNTMSTDGAHNHNFTTGGRSAAHFHNTTISGATTNAGSGGAHENRPPYRALCYIMKL